MSLSTHVLDTARGRPVAGMAVRLERSNGDGWTPVGTEITDSDGRITGWATEVAVHRLVFDTAGHLGEDAFYPEATVTFRITDRGEHYHIPLLLSPFAYSTYRGS